ncbi:hypothetical protein JI435_152040 [Parastagonospora nodorum SN15]|uniref:Uncharacterized protein n=1 Tax=Phaeosphaeria nodorum (strain SN15 / ATCC MYA-4574 / FGSC 10173) TaxID=321614 RepID=A0A7U2F7F7_PHANO|nr:hypothetical protein JI435_152040 [Parastagonospora nodorum SN15]
MRGLRPRATLRPPLSVLAGGLSLRRRTARPCHPSRPELPWPNSRLLSAQKNPPGPPPVATFTQQPASVAISESDNPDVIALRSAISLLQLQREKSKRDLKALAELKTVAVADPQGFVQSIQQNRAQAAQSYNDILTPTLAGLADSVSAAQGNANANAGPDTRKDSADVGAPAAGAPKFPAIPQAQNIVRCPPINWEKYHIVGEPLDKLHEEQKKWPGQPEPPRTQAGARAPPHSIAAPYSPFTDGIARKPSASHPPSKSSKKSPAHGP